jgi:hypothetical protein
VQWVDAPADATITVFDRFERAPDAAASARPDGTFEVQAAAPADLIEAASLVRACLPGVLADALDVHPWSLRSGNLLRRAEAERELRRTRDVIVLREAGTLRAAALCETGPRAASLFNIMNMAQIYARGGADAPSRAGQLALLYEVRRFYTARGIADPVVIAPKETVDGLADPDTRLAETMGCIALTTRALRQWQNFCRFHLGVQTLGANGT